MTGTTVLSDVDAATVKACADVSPDKVAAIRKIHEERLAEIRPQLAAIQRAVAMREASLAVLAALTGVPHD